MDPSAKDWRNRASAVIALALAAAALRCVARVYFDLPIAVPFQCDYEEGNILNAFTLILRGGTPWPDPRPLPSYMNPYGPVAYYLLILPVRIFGLELVYPRAMILGLVLLIAGLLAVELRRRTGSLVLGAAFGLIYLTIPNILDWAWLLRVDFLGIALTFTGLIVFSRRLDRVVPLDGAQKGAPPGVLPALLFAAALLVKLTLVAAPAACFLVLLARRRYRDAAWLAGVTAAIVGVVIGVFVAITHGAFWTDVFLAHPDPYSKRQFLGWLLRMIRESWPLVILAGIAVWDEVVARRRPSPPSVWIAIATATTFTSGALGSNTNHFLEWNTALVLAAGLGLARIVQLRSRAVGLAAATAAAVAMGFVLWAPRKITFIRGQDGCNDAYEWVRTQAGPNLLSENIGALVLGGRKLWLSNPFAFTQMVEHRGWSDAELLRMVREQRFDAVIVRSPKLMNKHYRRFPPSVLKAIGEYYEPGGGFQCRDMAVVFKPKRDAP